jgi:hypothetical protein
MIIYYKASKGPGFVQQIMLYVAHATACSNMKTCSHFNVMLEALQLSSHQPRSPNALINNDCKSVFQDVTYLDTISRRHVSFHLT